MIIKNYDMISQAESFKGTMIIKNYGMILQAESCKDSEEESWLKW